MSIDGQSSPFPSSAVVRVKEMETVANLKKGFLNYLTEKGNSPYLEHTFVWLPSLIIFSYLD